MSLPTLHHKVWLRVDMESLDEAEAFLKEFQVRNPTIVQLLATYEQPDKDSTNTHLHVQMNSLRDRAFVRRTLVGTSRMPSLIGSGGNASYAMGDPDAGTGSWEKGLRYVCKGVDANTPPVVMACVGPNINTDELHAEYWAQAHLVREARTRAHRESSNKLPMLESLRKLYEDKQPATAGDWCAVCVEFYKELPYSCNWHSFQDCVRKVGVENFEEVQNAQEKMLYRALIGDVMHSMS